VIEAGDNGWFGWSYIVEQLGWADLAPRVEQAYADGRIWQGMSSAKDFRKGLAKVLQAAPDDTSRFERDQKYLTDLLVDLGRYSFGPVDPLPASKPREPISQRETPRAAQWVETERNPMRHVGRNDPCPCGSGKKYKKCCLAA
jgi:thioesterase domain-containing protein